MIKSSEIGALDKLNFAAVRLLKLFDELSASSFTLDWPPEDYEDFVGIRHTAFKEYLAAFRAAGILKYTFSPLMISLNPDVFVTGNAIDAAVLDFIRKQYAALKSN